MGILKNKLIIKKILLSVMALGFIWFGVNFKDIYGRIKDLQAHSESINASSLDSYKIIKFSDGDTIEVEMNGKTETIRMLGIDTPETHHPDKPVQCFGTEASEKLNSFWRLAGLNWLVILKLKTVINTVVCCAMFIQKTV